MLITAGNTNVINPTVIGANIIILATYNFSIFVMNINLMFIISLLISDIAMNISISTIIKIAEYITVVTISNCKLPDITF